MAVAEMYKPHAKQIAAHLAFLTQNKKRGTLFWGRQVGKSLWCIQHLQMAALLKQGQYFIVFKTYKHAKDVVWRQYLHTLNKDLIAKTNDSELIIQFHHIKGPIKLPGIGWIKVEHDPNKPPSTIQLLGSDQADTHRGRKGDGIIFDEYQDQDPGNWDSVYKYFFTTTKGWSCFLGTAKGYNHWYDLLQYAKQDDSGWYYSEATWRDNPAIDPEFIYAEKKESEKLGTLNTFLQEVELEFRSVQGAVYPQFKRAVHVINPMDIPSDGTDFVTIDFGWAQDHPTAVNFIRIDIEDRWYVYDEVHVTETALDDIIETIKAKAAGIRITGVIGDSARPDLIEYMVSKGLPMIPAPKRPNSVPQGIQMLGQKMQARLQLVGMPKPNFYVTSNCKHTIMELEKYKYAEPKRDRPVSELPVKKDDNHPDGLRYLALYLKFHANETDKPIKAPVSFSEYGLLQ